MGSWVRTPSGSQQNVPISGTFFFCKSVSKSAFEAAKNDDFNAFVEERGKELLQRINTLCHVDEQTESTDFFEENDEYDE